MGDKLKIPKNFAMKSNAKPSLFAYPEPMQPPKKEEQSKAAAAVLSTAAKAKQNKEKKDKETAVTKGAMDVDTDDKRSVNSAQEAGSTAGVNASVMATPGTTIVGSTADSIAPSDLDSTMMDVEDQATVANQPSLPENKPSEPAPAPGSEDKKEGDAAGK